MLGISAQSLIGNAIVGMVLVISRTFINGYTVKVFDKTGIVEDIVLLHIRITTGEGNTLITPNTTLLNHAVLKLKVEAKDSKTDTAKVT